MYIGKERRIRMADRRVSPTDTPALGRRMGTGDRRLHRSNTMAIKNKYYAQQMEDFNAGERGSSPERFIAEEEMNKNLWAGEADIANPTEPPNPSDTAELLKKYRAALITAYELGKKVKETYQIVPPKVVISSLVTIGLQVN